LQFTNIARPIVPLAQIQSFPVNPADVFPHFFAKSLYEVLHKHRDIFFPIPQSRDLDREDIQPVKQIGPEGSCGDSGY
jgi:hypothetical protein